MYPTQGALADLRPWALIIHAIGVEEGDGLLKVALSFEDRRVFCGTR